MRLLYKKVLWLLILSISFSFCSCMINEPMPQNTMDVSDELDNNAIPESEIEEDDMDKQLRASDSYAVAESLLQIVQKEAISDTERASIFSCLPNLDWKAVTLYGRDNRSALNDDACMILFDWLCSVVPDMDEDEELATMQATQGLDGAYSESFAGLMVQIFDKDTIGFFQILSKIEQAEKIDNTIYLLYYGCLYKDEEELQQIIAVLNEYVVSPESSTQEQHLINLFLGKFS